MTITSELVRACAAATLDAIARHSGDASAIEQAIRPAFAALLTRDDLLEVGAPRRGNHVAESWWLYYDGDLSLLLYPLTMGHVVPPHDHGNWESMFVWRGAVKQTVWERVDDGSVEGKATLRIVDDRVMAVGDCAVIAPPADIHGFTAAAPDTYAITVACGAYKPERNYYQPEAGTVRTARPRAA